MIAQKGCHALSSVQDEFFFEVSTNSQEPVQPRASEVPLISPNGAGKTISPIKPDLTAQNIRDKIPSAGAGMNPPAVLFLSDKDVARRYSVSRPTIWRWLKIKLGFPTPIKIAEGTTRWRLKDLEEFEGRRSLATQELPIGTSGKGEGH